MNKSEEELWLQLLDLDVKYRKKWRGCYWPLERRPIPGEVIEMLPAKVRKYHNDVQKYWIERDSLEARLRKIRDKKHKGSRAEARNLSHWHGTLWLPS
jgi:hypothetical protein